MPLNLFRSFPVHYLDERLMGCWKHIIPRAGLPIIETVSWGNPGWEGNQYSIGQGAHKRLIRLS